MNQNRLFKILYLDCGDGSDRNSISEHSNNAQVLFVWVTCMGLLPVSFVWVLCPSHLYGSVVL